MSTICSLSAWHITPRSLALSVITGVLLTSSSGGAIAATEVNTCGQTFSGNGYLSSDLDCTGFPTDTVVIDGGTFDLKGFTLTGGDLRTISCTGACTVTSDPPGGIVQGSGGGDGIGMEPTATTQRITVKNIIISSGHFDGVDGDVGSVRIVDSSVLNAMDAGVVSGGGVVTVLRSTISGNLSTGIAGQRVNVVDSFVTDNGLYGVVGNTRASVVRSTLSGNLTAGIGAERIRVVDSTISGNPGDGVSNLLPDVTKVRGSTIQSNGGVGIRSMGRAIVRDTIVSDNGEDGIRQETFEKLKMINATVTGNGLHGAFQNSSSCDFEAVGSTLTGNGIDAACDAPDLQTTTCDTSYDTDSGFPGTSWGVCSLD